MARRGRVHFYVRPRYTPGSPGTVDEATALGVLDSERRSFEHAKLGRYGEEAKADADRLGLRGIVEEHRSHARGTLVTDVGEGGEYLRLLPERAERERRKMARSVKFSDDGCILVVKTCSYCRTSRHMKVSESMHTCACATGRQTPHE